MRSLVLLGHGSHLNGDSARAVYQYAELVRQRGLFSEVIEGFWKEEPSLRQVLKTTSSTDVTVVPMFISEGYFTETVLPRELGLGHQGPLLESGIGRVIGGRTVRYTLPYGVHPAMQDVILARAREALTDPADTNTSDLSGTALIVLGQGSTRGENSNRVIQRHADALRERGLFAEVHALFLDEEPGVTRWPELTRAPRVVIVPFFASGGEYTQEIIPARLSLSGPRTHFAEAPGAATSHGPRTVYYTPPVGTHPMIADVIVQVAQDARQNTTQGGDLDQTHEESWRLLTRLAHGGLRMGEVSVTPHGGLFELRHMLDEGRAASELTTYVTPEGLRQRIRLDDGGQYRPVRTFRTLPRGWRAVVDETDLRRAVHDLYPAVVEESRAYSCHSLRSTPWPTTARRQTGIYAKVQRATPAQVEQVARKVCANCLRTRLWAGETLHQTFLDGVPGGMPCAEACTYLVAAVRDELAAEA